MVTLASSLFASACSDSPQNDPPIIDFVDSPQAVSAQHGSFAIPMTIGFHDHNGEVITHVHYRMAPSIEGTIEIETPLPTRESADITIVLPASLATSGATAERRELEITIIDGRGAPSLPLTREVRLQ